MPKISKYTAATALNPTDEIVINQGGVTKKATIALMESATEIQVLSYADAALSGALKLIRLSYQGTWYYTKVYPTAGAEASSSGNTPGDNLYAIDDVALSGTPVVIGIMSGSVEYYFKAYPTVAGSTHHDGDTSLRLTRYADAALTGTPRIAKAVIGGTAYYWKVYPTKA
jgi:hypothetical protein